MITVLNPNEFSIEELIEIVDNEENYDESFIVSIKKELSQRNCLDITVETIAKENLQKKIKSYFENFDILNDELIMPKSRFLSNEVIFDLFREEFQQWRLNHESLRIDVEKYSIGGVFL